MRTMESKPRRRASNSARGHDQPSRGSFELLEQVDKEYVEEDDISGLAAEERLGSIIGWRWHLYLILVAIIVLSAIVISMLRDNTSTRPKSNVDENSAKSTDDALEILLHPEEHQFRLPKVITLYWNITAGSRAPDGVRKEVYLINGEFPGPTIEARSGDTLIIEVQNSLSGANSGLSLHWHGLFMRNANNMDGAVGFTQCPIPTGGNFTYEFKIDAEQHGTFWYHAHSHVQRGDGLYGGLVVHKPLTSIDDGKHEYQKEVLLLTGDWYHRPAEEILAWYTSVRAFGNEPVPDSLVINGAGSFNCAMAVPARPVDCKKILENNMPGILGWNLVPTRLRLVNVGTMAGFTVQITDAKLTPLEVDGGCEIQGSRSDTVGILYPGERVDLLVEWDKGPMLKNPRLHISLDTENFRYPNEALTPNQSFPIISPSINLSETPSTPFPPSSNLINFDLQTALSSPNIPPPATAVIQTILLYTKTLKLSIHNNHPEGFINRTSWSPQIPPLLSLPRSQWNKHQLVPHIPIATSATWVDIILNNLDDGAHPFHLHGHAFYIIASQRSTRGWGSYDPYATTSSTPASDFNFESPLRRDTVMVPRRGFVILRFKADNPGLWMLHCHILVHQGSGMAMGVQVGGNEEHVSELDVGARALCAE